MSWLCLRECALLANSTSDAFEMMPLDEERVVFVVTNSGVKHCNADDWYTERVQQC